MAWVKYNNDGLVNLDKITDINIVKVQDKEGNYIYMTFAFIKMKITYLKDILH